MSRRRKAVKQIRQILEYRLSKGISADKTALALSTSKGTVINVVHRFERAKLSWPLPADMSDSALESALFAPQCENTIESVLPDIGYLEQELRRPHMTLQRLWEEFNELHPNQVSRATFYRHWLRHRPKPVYMKMLHKGGDKLFVDFSGDRIEYINRQTGEIFEAELFVCSWGASSYSFAFATVSQRTDDFVNAHVKAFGFFGCTPQALVPDNLKSGVSKADRYDPIINPLYGKMAQHYGVAIVPARPVHPRDKAVVESNVLHVQRFILARLRNRQFFSVAEINEALREELRPYNDRPMKDYGGQTRSQRFEELDKPFARSLPDRAFAISRLKADVRVSPNYHIRFEDHFYSVPFHLVGKVVDVYQIGNLIEIYHESVHVCRHLVGAKRFAYTTISDHMPSNHRYVTGWSKEWFLAKAQEIGSAVQQAIVIIMQRQEHVQQGFNAALGILRLAKAYSPARLEAACQRAITYRCVSCRSINAILEQGLDKQLELALPASQPLEHENIRGNHYYQK